MVLKRDGAGLGVHLQENRKGDGAGLGVHLQENRKGKGSEKKWSYQGGLSQGFTQQSS